MNLIEKGLNQKERMKEFRRLVINQLKSIEKLNNEKNFKELEEQKK